MSILSSLRYPTALAFGLLLTASIFWSLWSFTNVTFEVTAVKSVPIEWTRSYYDTPPEKKDVPDIIEPPPVLPPPDIGGIQDPQTTIATIVLTTPVAVPDVGRPVTGIAQDRDVQPIVRVEPQYPQRAITNGIEGWVKVQFTITATGTVKDVVVVENSPSNIFDDASVKAVSRWRYNPRVEGAVAVERVGMQTILRFNLEEE